MNNPDTTPKPTPAEQPADEGLDETICSPSFDSRAKDAGLPYCIDCGDEMRPNVPRFGWDAGAVHASNSGLNCPSESLENAEADNILHLARPARESPKPQPRVKRWWHKFLPNKQTRPPQNDHE